VAPIGDAVQDMEVVLLAEDGSPAPEGAIGEIAVRSRYLATGYWRRPELTAERFLADPAGPGMRLYRTGDLGRFQPGRILEHLGRVDGLAKVRGQRVEAAEVEGALVAVPGVAAAAVTVREDAPGEGRLVAYLVSDGAPVPSSSDLRRALAGRLPDFMVPSAFVTLDRLPVNDNGKVDRHALPPPPAVSGPRAITVSPPRDAIEYTLVGIWEDVLGVRPIGIHDDFFDLGGHSLLAARMVEKVERVSGRSVLLTTLFEASTIERLARVLRSDECRPGPALVALHPGGTRPPLFFLHGDIAGGGFYSRGLARALGPEQPVYAVHPHGLGGEAVPPTIEAMAEDRLRALRAERPEGPYLLGGYCDGALVALEIARRLVVLRSEHLEDRRPDLGWSRVSRRVEVHSVPGDHLGCITRHVEATAARLRACLAALARG
jgi:hypothetical protein